MPGNVMNLIIPTSLLYMTISACNSRWNGKSSELKPHFRWIQGRMSAHKAISLDSTDIAIVEALQADGRLAISELGRRVGLSQPATSERVSRLEERGVITGYRAVISPEKLGLGMMIIIRVRTTHENIQPCLKLFSEMPEIIEVHRLTGEDCFHLKVIVPTPWQLERIVDGVARFGSVTTSLVLRSEPAKPISHKLIKSVG